MKNKVAQKQIAKLEYENQILREQLVTFMKKNKRVWSKVNYENVIMNEDKSKISFATVLLTFEYMFFYQKLFEMHVYDYIVDKQNPDNKTDEDDKKLIKICKEWSTKITINQAYRMTLKVEDFKKAFKTFVKPYIETKNDMRIR